MINKEIKKLLDSSKISLKKIQEDIVKLEKDIEICPVNFLSRLRLIQNSFEETEHYYKDLIKAYEEILK